MAEVKAYRAELHDFYSHWGSTDTVSHLLSFLADTLDATDLLDGALKYAGRMTAYPEDAVGPALTCRVYESCDMDLWLPVLSVAEAMQDWGWLQYRFIELDDRVWIEIDHREICTRLGKQLMERISQSKHPSRHWMIEEQRGP